MVTENSIGSATQLFQKGAVSLWRIEHPRGERLEVRHSDRQIPLTNTDAWVQSRLFDAESGANGAFLVFKHPFTREEVDDIIWDYELAGSDTTAVFARLAQKGLTVNRESIVKGVSTHQIFGRYLMEDYDGSGTIRPVIAIRSEPGWSKDLRSYVLGDEVLPSNAGISTFPRHKAFITDTPDNIEYWHKLVKLAKHSRMWRFIMQASFAGPIIRPLNVPSFVMGGFHFYGLSSRGKSRGLDIGKAVWGSRNLSWNGTKVSMAEDLGHAHNDRVAFIDEIGQAGPRGKGADSGSQTVLNLLYELANGIGRTRRVNVTNLEKPKEWRCLWVSVGESSIRDFVAPIEPDLKEGQRLRGPDISISHELFDNGLTVSKSRQLSRDVEDLAPRCGGAAGRLFVQHLIGELQANPTYWVLARREYEDIYNTEFAPMVKHASHSRLAERCALVAYAGKLAARYGLLPDDYDYVDAPKAVLEVWMETDGRQSVDDVQRCAQNIVAWIDANRGGRLASIVFDSNGDRAADRLADYRRFGGFISDDETQSYPRIYLTTDVWRSLVANFGGSPTICRAFKRLGILHTNQGKSGRNQFQMPELRMVDQVHQSVTGKTFTLGRVVCRRNAKMYCLNLQALEDYAQGLENEQ